MIPLADPEQLLPLHFKCWLYAELAKLADHNAALAEFFRLKRGPTSRWTIDAVPSDTTANSNQEGKVFVPLEVIFTAESYRTRKTDEQLFNELYPFVSSALVDDGFGAAVGLDEDSRPVFWSLVHPDKPHDDKVARWTLPGLAAPLRGPAETVEKVLSKLVKITQRVEDPSHDHCGTEAAFDCIENQFYEQKQICDDLGHYLDMLQKDTNKPTILIDSIVSSIESIDLRLGAILTLLNKELVHSKKPKPILLRLIRRLLGMLLFRTLHPPVPYRPSPRALARLRERACLDLAALRRMAPVLAAHARLMGEARWRELDAACAAAPDGPERREMPARLAVRLDELADEGVRARTLGRARVMYAEAREKVVGDVEAVLKAVGGPVVRGVKSERLFKKKVTFCRAGVCSHRSYPASVKGSVEEEWDEKL